MDRDALRAYARRDWDAVEELDRAHWAETWRRSPDVGFRVSAALAQYARRNHPDWPSVAERRRDLGHHVKLKRRIDRAARAFASR